jgi:phage terminase large subunit
MVVEFQSRNKMLSNIIMPPKKTQRITLGEGKDKNTFTIKKGALHRQLGVPDSYKFSKAELRKINVETGKKFEWKGKPKTMTPLLKKRITLALTLMSGK